MRAARLLDVYILPRRTRGRISRLHRLRVKWNFMDVMERVAFAYLTMFIAAAGSVLIGAFVLYILPVLR